MEMGLNLEINSAVEEKEECDDSFYGSSTSSLTK